MFEDFSTTDFCPDPRVINSVCDLPSIYTCLFWDPAVPGELFTAMEWTSVLLNRSTQADRLIHSALPDIE